MAHIQALDGKSAVLVVCPQTLDDGNLDQVHQSAGEIHVCRENPSGDKAHRPSGIPAAHAETLDLLPCRPSSSFWGAAVRSRDGAQETSAQGGPSGERELDRESRPEGEEVWVEEAQGDACLVVVHVLELERFPFFSCDTSPFTNVLRLLVSNKLLSEQLTLANRVTTTFVCAHNRADVVPFASHKCKQ